MIDNGQVAAIVLIRAACVSGVISLVEVTWMTTGCSKSPSPSPSLVSIFLQQNAQGDEGDGNQGSISRRLTSKNY